MKKILILLLPVCIMIMALQTKPKPKPAAAPSKITMDSGKKVYDAVCLACHQASGMGVPRVNPPLVKTSYIKGSKTKLIQIVLKGMNSEQDGDIDGETYTGVMAPHSDLTDRQIADVLTYVRNSFGNKGTVVTPAEVKAVRVKLPK
jgi:mono/diheme cytochrome c family protein